MSVAMRIVRISMMVAAYPCPPSLRVAANAALNIHLRKQKPAIVYHQSQHPWPRSCSARTGKYCRPFAVTRTSTRIDGIRSYRLERSGRNPAIRSRCS